MQHSCALLLLQPTCRSQHTNHTGSCLCMTKQRLGSSQLNCRLASCSGGTTVQHGGKSANLNGVAQCSACNQDCNGTEGGGQQLSRNK